jgi:hypothetical protein
MSFRQAVHPGTVVEEKHVRAEHRTGESMALLRETVRRFAQDKAPIAAK